MAGSKTSLLLWTRGICRGWPSEEEEGGPGYTWPGVWNLTLRTQFIIMSVIHKEEEEKLKSGSPVDQTGIRASYSKSRGAR